MNIPNISLAKLRHPAIFCKDTNLIIQICGELTKYAKELPCFGLHAKQIGYEYPIFIVKQKDDIQCFVHALYIPMENSTIRQNKESCLSFDGVYDVERYNNIVVCAYYLRDGELNPIKFEVHNDMACVFEHEIGHSMGELICDIGTKVELIEDKS
jgi:peptide deformylase